ncbi:MAG TPA: nuclear transport factor 2 family protein [Tahibacter sp.]|uniref:nuclear transport factor 2 family protein n=1 Tax=Tahibacter sp. TaxID=2056211 RepID=UPI002C12143C|nr:nuclear transport factor 2 family protein [Tahibacter sp.]HSX59189.1 nuclear transport factor 2 family protein [Tahibacter sp.]
MKRWLWLAVLAWPGLAPAQETPEAAADALWRALSHGPNAGADREALQALFAPGAQVYGLSEREGRRVLRQRSAAEFVEAQAKPGAGAFHEREVHREVRRYADFAEVFATVESRTDAGADKADFTGINSLHLVEQDGRWRILSLYYALERPGQPLPAAWRGRPSGKASPTPPRE